ncbi:hypothetical protein ABZ330_31010 [Streptomyces sp. NPDC006172]|uniref:hypothetical protein n=1 Tax=Streptomyces sp. NPDC006172 TaxID=3154470 RepID=UPI00340A0609
MPSGVVGVELSDQPLAFLLPGSLYLLCILVLAWELGRKDGDDMTEDDLLAVLQVVARLAASAVNIGGGLYSWSF